MKKKFFLYALMLFFWHTFYGMLYSNTISTSYIPIISQSDINKIDTIFDNSEWKKDIFENIIYDYLDYNIYHTYPFITSNSVLESKNSAINSRSIFGDYSIRLSAFNLPQVDDLASIASHFGAIGDYIILVYSFLAYSKDIRMTFNTIKNVELFIVKGRSLSVFFEYSSAINKRDPLMPQFLQESPSEDNIIDILLGIKFYFR